MSWVAVALLSIVLASAAAVVGLLVVRRIGWLQRAIGENDVPGLLFGAIGVLYGALLAFIVVGTWQTFSGAEQAVTTEGADLVAVYRDTQEFPQPLQLEIQGALRTYATQVMATEWQSHGNLVVHQTPDLLNPVWELYREIQPTTPAGDTQLAAAREHLHTLEQQRHLRHLSSEASLPPIFWPILVAGSIIIVLFSFTFHQSNVRVQAVMTGLFAAFLASVLVLIFSLNQPFTGPIAVSQQPLQHALAQMDAIDLPAPIP